MAEEKQRPQQQLSSGSRSPGNHAASKSRFKVVHHQQSTMRCRTNNRCLSDAPRSTTRTTYTAATPLYCPALHNRNLSLKTPRRKLRGMRDGIARNQAFLDAVVEFQDTCSPFPLGEGDGRVSGGPSRTTATQVSKINTTLRQCMRDWSGEGEDERRESYGGVIAELERLCPVDPEKNGAKKVLVPGAGEGRLAYEIVSRGYGCTGAFFCASLSSARERGLRPVAGARIGEFSMPLGGALNAALHWYPVFACKKRARLSRIGLIRPYTVGVLGLS